MACVALTGACGDDLTDPAALMDAEEAEAVLQSAEALPLLPRFLEAVEPSGARDRAVLQRSRELWDSGSGMDAGSPIRRRLAVGYALPVLLDRVPEEEWLAARERTDAWVVRVNDMLQQLSLPGVESKLRAAERLLARADQVTNPRGRAYYLLLAGVELVETTPRYVARTLAAEADAAVALAREQGLRSGDTLDRAERLKNWSARAVEEGDYLRAIQRAYYALQLVEGE